LTLSQLQGWRPPAGLVPQTRPLLGRPFSRAGFLRGAAGAGAGLLAASAWRPAFASADVDGSAPRPIPDGIQPFGPGTELYHVYPPAAGFEQSTITDFDGWIGSLDAEGTGTGRDTVTGRTTPLVFQVDMRFMDGDYLAVDGQMRRGTFALI
jgi:hypothetical protein